jgi:hypothetical protein
LYYMPLLVDRVSLLRSRVGDGGILGFVCLAGRIIGCVHCVHRNSSFSAAAILLNSMHSWWSTALVGLKPSGICLVPIQIVI